MGLALATSGTEVCGAVGGASSPQCREGPTKKIFRLCSLPETPRQTGHVTTANSALRACPKT